eukprot:113008-Amphidinium_carterae.1
MTCYFRQGYRRYLPTNLPLVHRELSGLMDQADTAVTPPTQKVWRWVPHRHSGEGLAPLPWLEAVRVSGGVSRDGVVRAFQADATPKDAAGTLNKEF